MVSLFLAFRPATTPAADVSAKVTDPFGRPVPDAIVEIFWLKPVSQDDARTINLAKLVSDRDGIIKGTYDEKSVPADEDILVGVSKPGFSGYSKGLEPEYVLKREFGAADLHRIATLDGDAQVNELRELLAGEFQRDGEGLDQLVFVQERRFRPALRKLVPDAKVGMVAIRLLAGIGIPEDVRLIVDHAPAPKRIIFEDRWAYPVACALLEPATEKEWAFLRRCALDEYDDSYVQGGAIQSIRLIASPRSLEILKEVKKAGEYDDASIERAIQYVESNPPALTDEDLIAAGKKVAQAVGIGNWEANEKPRLNENGDKALIDLIFISRREGHGDDYTFTAAFHKVDAKWKLRSVRQVMQRYFVFKAKTEGKPDEK